MIERSNEEMGEIVREWIRHYLPSIILGIVLALAVLFGIDYWNEHKHRSNSQLNYILEQMVDEINSGDTDKAILTYQQKLQNDHTEQGNIAAMLIASVYLDKQEKQKALAAWEKASKAQDEVVAHTAKWQLAKQKVADGDYARADLLMNDLAKSMYAAQINLLRGDSLYLQGKKSEALAAYRKAAQDSASPILSMTVDILAAEENLTAQKIESATDVAEVKTTEQAVEAKSEKQAVEAKSEEQAVEVKAEEQAVEVKTEEQAVEVKAEEQAVEAKTEEETDEGTK